MAFTIVHPKVNNIPDWTQADLDAQIALGNFPPGTVLADITQPSDWNDDHTLSGMLNQISGYKIIDMGNADYTMTDDEASYSLFVVVNAGDGTKTLLMPTTSDSFYSAKIHFITGFAGNTFFFGSETGGAPTEIISPFNDIISYFPSGSPLSMFNSMVHQGSIDASAVGVITAASADKVYAAITGKLNTSSAGLVTKTTVTESSAATDAGKRVYCSNASAVTYTIEPSSTANLGENATFRLQAGAGGITIAAGAGVTLVGSTTVAAYDCITCDRDGTTETWYL